METSDKLSVRGRFVRSLLAAGVVVLACVAYFVAVMVYYRQAYPSPMSLLLSRDMLLTFLLISIIWATTESSLKLNEVYRSRPYSYILILHVVENLIGLAVLLLCMVLFGLPNYGRMVLALFCVLSIFLSFSAKILFYHALRVLRRKGRNMRSVLFVCDRSGERLLALINRHFEWGYKVVGVVGDDYMMEKQRGRVPVYPISTTGIDTILSQDVDELIYARDRVDSADIERLVGLCSDYGITFRLYSSFLNRMSSSACVRYFDTNAVLTISNMPSNYVGLLVKRLIDVVISLCVILVGLPFFLIVALLIKVDSKGPVFFKQKRSGLRGKVFEVFKFRTMVVNAEQLKKELMDKNEMTGPVFKMTNDPRITRMGRILRKTGVDEFPQFLNVLFGDMSIVGPRPPLPSEVEQYERWQMRRLAMKPGITCIWQVASNRNSITFEDWMRMDMEYIDNWSLELDLVLMFKTAATILRADGK